MAVVVALPASRRRLLALLAGLSVLWLSSCSVTPDWLTVSQTPSTPLSSAELEALNSHNAIGQFDVTWPEQSSKRALVNNRRRFTAYSGQGRLLLDLQNADHITLKINGKPVTVRSALHSNKRISIDISRFSRDGINQLELSNITPLGATVRLVAPFPELKYGTPEQTGFEQEVLSELDDIIEKDVAQGFPGAVLLIARNGKIIKHSAYGFANRYQQNGEPLNSPEAMQPDTVFDLASNTKMYATNYALMQLVSSGKLDVNKPVSYYLAEYQGDGREQRLVSDLLHHTAGYDPEVHFHRPDNRHGPQFYSLERENSLKLIASQVPFARPRAEKAVYSDIDYMLLGLIIERITGQTQDQYLEQQLYRPMGLMHTAFNPLQKGIALSQIAATELDGNSRGGRVLFEADKRTLVRGNVHDEKARYAFGGVAGHAGLFSNAHDTARLAFLALTGGYGVTRVFDEKTVQQFVSPSAIDASMGLGWRTASDPALNWHFGPYASRYAFGHTGWTGTVTVIDPFYQLVVVLLTNKKHSPILADGEKSYYFTGDTFETGMYGSIMSKIYEAMH